MKKFFVIISALFFYAFFCCNQKQEHSETYLKALSYYEEGINLTSCPPIKNDSLLKALPIFIDAARLLEQLPEDMSKEEISLVSKTYHEMSKIMFLKMSRNTQIDALKRALYYQEMNIDSNMMAILAADLALTYSSTINDTTEIMHYIRLAEPYLDTTDYIEPYLKVKSSLSMALYSNMVSRGYSLQQSWRVSCLFLWDCSNWVMLSSLFHILSLLVLQLVLPLLFSLLR